MKAFYMMDLQIPPPVGGSLKPRQEILSVGVGGKKCRSSLKVLQLSHKEPSLGKLSDIKGISKINHRPMIRKRPYHLLAHSKPLPTEHALWHLYNALGTFKRCMMAIFHDMIKKTGSLFMDDFRFLEKFFLYLPNHLKKMLKRCEDTKFSLKTGRRKSISWLRKALF
ncbi:hypothetical protein Tco_1354759 [Tanacetum coccineum]